MHPFPNDLRAASMQVFHRKDFFRITGQKNIVKPYVLRHTSMCSNASCFRARVPSRFGYAILSSFVDSQCNGMEGVSFLSRALLPFVLLTLSLTAEGQDGFFRNFVAQWEARANKTQAIQPRWSVPMFSPFPMVAQVFRTDFIRQQTHQGRDQLELWRR